MTTQRRLNISDLDFDQIKTNLTNFLKSDPNFTDYDFSGSILSSVIDLLAYNTFYNAFNSNVIVNEVFLDTAQLRNNVVSHAKMLGYIPRSKTSAFTYLNINVVNPTGNPTSLTIDRGTRFTSLVNNVIYEFVNLEGQTISPVAGEYNFNAVKINQGVLKTVRYLVDDSDTRQTYQLPEDSIDTSSIIVKVKDTFESSSYSVYTKNTNIVNIDGLTQVYFIQEGLDGKYEIYFGDDVFGKKLIPGNLIEIEYLVTDAELANGASSFSLADTIQGNSAVIIESVDSSGLISNRANGGGDRESIDSIKYNAPLTFLSQNRVVTADDYKATILNNYSNIETITAWGGEENEPPEYGKVYISIKPKNAEVLPADQKTFIVDSILKTKNIVSITPEIVDPTYTYVNLEVFFKYDPNLTDRTAGELKNLVTSIINTYNNEDLKRFDGVFRHSKLLRLIDTSDTAILNSNIRSSMEKRFVPILNTIARYELQFSSPLYSSRTNERVISTDEFEIDGENVFIEDSFEEEANGTRKLYSFRTISDVKVIINNDVGYVDPSTGIVVLNGINITGYNTTAGHISVKGIPNSFDIAPKRNQLVIISMDDLTVTPQIDTIATGGSIAGIGYTTTPRHSD